MSHDSGRRSAGGVDATVVSTIASLSHFAETTLSAMVAAIPDEAFPPWPKRAMRPEHSPRRRGEGIAAAETRIHVDDVMGVGTGDHVHIQISNVSQRAAESLPDPAARLESWTVLALSVSPDRIASFSLQNVA